MGRASGNKNAFGSGRFTAARKRLFNQQAPLEVREAMFALLHDPSFSAQRGYLSDIDLYVRVGRDRASLTMDYIDSARKEAEAFAAAYADMSAPPLS